MHPDSPALDGALVSDRALVNEGALVNERALVHEGGHVNDRALPNEGSFAASPASSSIASLHFCVLNPQPPLLWGFLHKFPSHTPALSYGSKAPGSASHPASVAHGLPP